MKFIVKITVQGAGPYWHDTFKRRRKTRGSAELLAREVVRYGFRRKRADGVTVFYPAGRVVRVEVIEL